MVLRRGASEPIAKGHDECGLRKVTLCNFSLRWPEMTVKWKHFGNIEPDGKILTHF